MTFTFNVAGTKYVRLTVTSRAGTSRSVVHDVVVGAGSGPPPPPADADGDGVPDSSDRCPNDPGPASNNGCPTPPPPPADGDGDGVPDSSDQCPNTPGPASNNGCPITSPPPGGDRFPNLSTTGVPAGWVPKQTLSSLSVNTAGAVIEDVLVTGAVTVNAPNVTLRRVLIRGTLDNMTNGACRGNGLVIEDSTFEPPGGRNAFWNVDQFQIGQGGYTLRRVQAWHESDGPRIGGAGLGCGPTHIEDSFINIDPSGICGAGGHSDGVQGYGAGAGNTVTNTTIDFENPGGCGGNAGFFFPGGPDNPPPASVTVNRLLIFGNRDNFSFRMGTAGSVQGLRIVNNSWGFGPIVITDLGCSAINPWEAKIVTVDKTTWTVTGTVRDQPCG